MSLPHKSTRRRFLQTSTAAAAASAAPYWFSSAAAAKENEAPSDRLVVGAIGVGSQGSHISMQASKFGEVAAVADVDQLHLARFQGRVQGKRGNLPEGYSDYRRLLERQDIDAVIIGTPDHWHTKIAIEALQAGKDVYCEKPLTLTIEEGKLINKAVRETGRIFQVGTQQRSEMDHRFLQAKALLRTGRIGEVRRVWVAIDGAPDSGLLKPQPTPCTLDWEMWLGQAPEVAYTRQRCHGDFRWWYEYSGGKLTDWGAHHVDIAQWGLDLDNTSPVSVSPLSFKHPVPFKDGYPTQDNRYNTATEFQIDCKFAGGLQMRIANRIDEEVGKFGNGILFEGTRGRFFVNRGRITGKPVEELKDNPLPEDALQQVNKGRPLKSHMADFFDCIKTREEPVSDVFSHHRILTTCHLSNIAIRLGRSLQWDPEAETIVGDPQASAMLSREQRAGYEIPKV